MCSLSSSSRSFGLSQASGQITDPATTFTGKDFYQELIDKANSVSLLRIFKFYKIRIDEINNRIICPFKSHKGGRESTGSFQFYPDTNSFNCFGCAVGGKACNFVAEIERISKIQAANKIINSFNEDLDEVVYNSQDLSERIEILIDFSNTIREFFLSFQTEHARLYAEGACAKFDDLYASNLLKNNEALKRAVEFAKQYILNYENNNIR